MLEVPSWRRGLSLLTPFALCAAFFAAAADELWLVALFCTMALSFVTYGSISHDLVHRTLRLPRLTNDVLLCTIELLTLRSGHAYQFTHLFHHAHFPADDEPEGAAARMPWWRALLNGVVLQPQLYLHALRKSERNRGWIIGEGVAVVLLLIAAIASLPWTPAPAVYAALMIMGAWIFPFVTVYIPHNASGTTALSQTRLFRGRLLSLIAFEHLYHLEHHLYPQIPHHNWSKLARKLDPYFESEGVTPIRLMF